MSNVNVRWAHNAVTTNGDTDEAQLSVISVLGRRVGSVTRTGVGVDGIEALVRDSESACLRRPEAPDYMPVVGGDSEPDDWQVPAADTDLRALDPLVAQLAGCFDNARRQSIATFGYAELQTATTFLATSAGLRRRHTDRLGKVEVTAKTPDFLRSSWAGRATADFSDINLGSMFEDLRQRLAWASRRIDMPAGSYEVLFEPSCAADLTLAAYGFMARRDADEGRSPYSKPGGGTRLGERLFGNVSFYSDPDEPGIATAPFHYGADSGAATSIFDNGVPLQPTSWARDGILRNLVTPRYWAARVGADRPVPFINNLVVEGRGAALDDMIARTDRALLVTCLWYIRTVDPQTALVTGLTRDGVFLIERGQVTGAVNNFRWNMSPITALAQAIEVGSTGPALPREHDEFIRTKAPALRIERFNMSSVSDAS